MRQRKGRDEDAVKLDDDHDDGGVFPQMEMEMDGGKLFIACMVFRVVNALVVRTYFNPDEHWQGPEVAHRIVFGFGHLTWEWEKGLRSYLHPIIFALLYKLLSLLHLDKNIWLMIRSPRLLQSVFAALGDYYLYKLTHRLFGQHAATWALFCQAVNWFTFFCIVRTLSNSLETVLTIMALYYWPLKNKLACNSTSSGLVGRRRQRQLALFFAALACIIRPTSAVIWSYLGIMHLLMTDERMRFVLAEVIPIGSFTLGLSCALDRWMYGSWILVPLNFIKFNFINSGGDFYGTHPWHWYFTQGFPTITFSLLPFIIAGMYISKEWQLSGLITWVLSLYSILGHKEFRFILPVLPLSMMFAGYTLAILDIKGIVLIQTQTQLNVQIHKQRRQIVRRKRKWLWIFVSGILITNVPMALYMSLVHQRGSEAVMEYLASEAAQGNVESVMFLMPCHSTPFFSYLHQNISMRFLDCSPSDRIGYVDEADRFMLNPEEFLVDFFKGGSSMPSHIILFDSLETRLQSFLKSSRYRQVKQFFHSHFSVDRERQGRVIVYMLQTSLLID